MHRSTQGRRDVHERIDGERDTRPRSRSLMRGCVMPQWLAASTSLQPLSLTSAAICRISSERAQVGGLLGRIGKRIPNTGIGIGPCLCGPVLRGCHLLLPDQLRPTALRQVDVLHAGCLCLLPQRMENDHNVFQARRVDHPERACVLPDTDLSTPLAIGRRGFEIVRLQLALQLVELVSAPCRAPSGKPRSRFRESLENVLTSSSDIRSDIGRQER